MNVQPISYSYNSSVNSLNNSQYLDKIYSADGTSSLNPWTQFNKQNNQRNFKSNTAPINLYKQYGGVVGGYQHSMVRPMDTVMVPRDIRRGTGLDQFIEKCDWPNYAGSKFQQWCSEENAIKYHAMRPIVEIDEYNKMLKKLFETVLLNSKKLPIFVSDDFLENSEHQTWSAVFSTETQSNIMNYIMLEVAKAVKVLPDMHKNGSWKVEQFYWTDPLIYEVVYKGKLYIKVLFNLYNPLRSTSTQVQVTLTTNIKAKFADNSFNGNLFLDKDIKIIEFDFINKEWNDGGIDGHNTARAGRNYQINLETSPIPQNNGWLYENTLLKQEFNKYGYYDNNSEYNLNIDVDLPTELKNKIKNFENTAPEYLLPAGTVRLNEEGQPKSMLSNHDRIYASYTDLSKGKNNTSMVNSVNYIPNYNYNP